jgi:choline-sulfatase
MKAAQILLLCCLATAAAGQSTTKKTMQPDVFLVTIDTLRADHVHCFGDQQIQTPVLDRLCKDGVRFSQAFTPSPITNTSHTTILTGLLPSTHGVMDFAMPLAATHPTWAELLKARGYHTAAFIGAVILDAKAMAPGLDRGFDFYDNFPEHPPGKSRWGRVERRGMDVVQHAEGWLGTHRAGPHFVWVHLFDPHDPYEPPPPYSQIYKDRPYDGEIAYADSALGHFIAYLEKQGWYNGALVIVVVDHGEGLGEHQENTHGIFLYDSTTHVPLIVKLPGRQAAGREVTAQVRTTDILPTVLDVLGVEAPERTDGASLQPYFTGAETAGRSAFGETDYPLHFGWAPLRSVRDTNFKYIEAPRPEFYDLHSDPGELHNGYEAGNATIERLRGMLEQLRDSGSSTQAPPLPSLPDPKDKIQEQNLLHSAVLALDDEREADARAALEEVLRLDAKSPTALLQLGQIELAAKNYAKAADYLRRELEVRPEDASAAFDYGRALHQTGHLEEARDALQTSLKLNPNQIPARLLLAKIYLALNSADAAQDQLEAALLTEPDNGDAQLGQAEVLIAQQKFDEARKALVPLTRSQPNNGEVYELLAKAYSGLGKKEDAAAAERRAQVLQSRKKAQ